jgi:ferritin-like metal-binding protein YciE
MASSKSAGRNMPSSSKSAPAAKSSKSSTKKALPTKAFNKGADSKKSPSKKAASSPAAAVKKAAVKKAVVKKAVKKAIVKKAVVRNAAKKAIVKKAIKKAVVKKAVAKSVKKAAVKAVVKKAVAKKVVAAKKEAVKKAVVRKAVAKKVVASAAKKAIVKKAIARQAVKKAIVKKAIARAASKSAGAKASAAAPDNRQQLENLLHGLMSEASVFQKLYMKAVAKKIRSASNGPLKGLFQKHQEEAQWFLKQLETAFSMLNLKAKPAKSAALLGIVQDSEAYMAQLPKGAGLDAALIASSQKFRHYEAAAFLVLRRLALMLGHDKLAEVFEILRQGSNTLNDELSELGDESLSKPESIVSGASGNSMAEDTSTEDSQAGEDSSSHVSGNEENGNAGSNGEEDGGMSGGNASYDEVADGGDREGASETGEPMGY